MTRNLNRTTASSAAARRASRIGSSTTAAINVQGPYGQVDYDSLQASVNKRMSSGLQYTVAYTYAKAIDWWAGTIPQPEYWYLNKGDQANSTPHLLNTSVIYELPFGDGRKFLSEAGRCLTSSADGRSNAFFTARSGTPFTVTANGASLNAGNGTNQTADQVKATRRFSAGSRRISTSRRSGRSPRSDSEPRQYNSLRGPGCGESRPELVPDVRAAAQHDLQLRVEALNATNTPHFANPASNVSNLQLNPDGTVRNLNGFGVITSTNRLGRQYDEREWRLGVRMTF